MRVIAGSLASRRLHAVAGNATRPTSDRVKEALFSILGDVHDARVLDLYAGTGSLGIEALSRGAAHAVFVERSAVARKTLELNQKTLAIGDRSVVIGGAVAQVGPRLRPHAPFDLVLCDPPYADAVPALAIVEGLVEHFSVGARIVLEHAKTAAPDARLFHLEERRIYGDTALSFFVVRDELTARAEPR
jgi:16S rRNA (guanine966-N2)-methyltransferase